MVVENLVRHHSLTNSRYEDGFTFPVFFGVLSILFSFGKGLIFFAPAIFLPVRGYFTRLGAGGQKLYRAYGLWIAFIVGMVAVYAGWYVWSGNWFWGPRFFLLAALPCSLALAVRLHRPGAASLPGNLLTLGLLALCVWVGINGTVFDVNALVGPCGRVTGQVCVYLPQNSALWLPAGLAAPAARREAAALPGVLTRRRGIPGRPAGADHRAAVASGVPERAGHLPCRTRRTRHRGVDWLTPVYPLFASMRSSATLAQRAVSPSTLTWLTTRPSASSSSTQAI